MDERDRLLEQPHMVPLMELIRELRDLKLEVPNPDPNDGGVDARALFLLESPGPKAVGSGYISRDNPDPSARNMTRALETAGFARKDVLLWNVVPYCVSSVSKNSNASRMQICQAVPVTQQFIDRLPKLMVIVFCGRRAQIAAGQFVLRKNVSTLKTFHPGGQSYSHARCREDIARTFRKAYEAILT